MTRRTFVASLVASAAVLPLGLTACNADRAGTLGGNVSVYLDSCSGAAGSTSVTWSGPSTASVRVTYRSGTTNKNSAWTATGAAATDGTVSVAVPTGATTDGWTITKVDLATAANGGGTKTSKAINCATAVTTTTAPVVSQPPVTLPPVTVETTIVDKPTTTEATTTTEAPTTVPTCSTLPVNTAPPFIYKPGDLYLHVDEGTWEAGPNCSLIGWAHQWERSFNYGPWEGFSGLQDWYLPCGLGYRYRVTVTRANQLGNTDATSAVVTGSGC